MWRTKIAHSPSHHLAWETIVSVPSPRHSPGSISHFGVFARGEEAPMFGREKRVLSLPIYFSPSGSGANGPSRLSQLGSRCPWTVSSSTRSTAPLLSTCVRYALSAIRHWSAILPAVALVLVRGVWRASSPRLMARATVLSGTGVVRPARSGTAVRPRSVAADPGHSRSPSPSPSPAPG